MKQGLMLLQWLPSYCPTPTPTQTQTHLAFHSLTSLPLTPSKILTPLHCTLNISSPLDPHQQHQAETDNDDEDDQEEDFGDQPVIISSAAKEKRRQRNANRKVSNWKAEIDEKFGEKPDKKNKKKRLSSEVLELNELPLLGPQWWRVNVSGSNIQSTVDNLTDSLRTNFPDREFEVFFPAVQVKRMLKDGTIKVKPRTFTPGTRFVLLRCVLDQEVHDFVTNSPGVYGFDGDIVKIGRTKTNKPTPTSQSIVANIFRLTKEEQDKADQAFQYKHEVVEPDTDDLDPLANSTSLGKEVSKPASRGRKKNPKIGSTVKVLSGAFADYSGILQKLDRTKQTAFVGITVLGKETIAEVSTSDIVEVVVEEQF